MESFYIYKVTLRHRATAFPLQTSRFKIGKENSAWNKGTILKPQSCRVDENRIRKLLSTKHLNASSNK